MYITTRLKTQKKFKVTPIQPWAGLPSKKAYKSFTKANKLTLKMVQFPGFRFKIQRLVRVIRTYCALSTFQMRKLARLGINQIDLRRQFSLREPNLNALSCNCGTKKEHLKKIREHNTSWTNVRLTILHNKSTRLKFLTSKLFGTMSMLYQLTSSMRDASKRNLSNWDLRMPPCGNRFAKLLRTLKRLKLELKMTTFMIHFSTRISSVIKQRSSKKTLQS